MVEEIGLKLSPGMFEGGVRRFPTFAIADEECAVGNVLEYVMYFCEIAGGGGSSKC